MLAPATSRPDCGHGRWFLLATQLEIARHAFGENTVYHTAYVYLLRYPQTSGLSSAHTQYPSLRRLEAGTKTTNNAGGRPGKRGAVRGHSPGKFYGVRGKTGQAGDGAGLGYDSGKRFTFPLHTNIQNRTPSCASSVYVQA